MSQMHPPIPHLRPQGSAQQLIIDGRTVKLGPELGVCRLRLNRAVAPTQHQERMMSEYGRMML